MIYYGRAAELIQAIELAQRNHALTLRKAHTIMELIAPLNQELRKELLKDPTCVMEKPPTEEK